MGIVDLILGCISCIFGAAVVLLALRVFRTRRQRFADHRRQASEYTSFVEGVRDTAIYMLDTNGCVRSWNDGAERLKGYTQQEAMGVHVSRFYSAEDFEGGVPEALLKQAEEAGTACTQGWRIRKDGSRFWADVKIEALRDDRGRHTGFAKITRDLTDQRKTEHELAELSGTLDAALDNMVQGVHIFDADQRLIRSNKRAAEIFGLPRSALRPGMSVQEMRDTIRKSLPPAQAENYETEALRLHEHFKQNPNSPPQEIQINADFVVAFAKRDFPDGGWVATVEDVSERHRSAERIRHMATHDALTGLPNRANFRRHTQKLIEQSRASGCAVAVAMIDLDRFKEVNDSLGHAAGDERLVEVSEILRGCVSNNDFAARIGGDEFAVSTLVGDEAELASFARRISRCFSPRGLESHDSGAVPASVGVACSSKDDEGFEELCANADLAMYRAKRRATDNFCIYRPGMDEELKVRRAIQADLRTALADNQFHLVYQVQCSVADGSITGFEALLRWDHPSFGNIAPAQFIPAAEENLTILPIGEWVIRQACRDAASWDQPFKVAVNVSPVQLAQRDLPRIVSEALLDSGLPPKRLELEITESAIVANKVKALHNLRQIKNMGVSIAIDDFGTGYSSLDTLNSFGFDKIKIDRSFLLNSEANPQARAIIRAVLALGKSMGLPVLAEGVENQTHLALLRREDCAEAQGYFFGHPAKKDERGNEEPSSSEERRKRGTG